MPATKNLPLPLPSIRGIATAVAALGFLLPAVTTACSADDDGCSIAEECPSRNGATNFQSKPGYAVEMCGSTGTISSFLHGNGSSNDVVSWSNSNEMCTCKVTNGALSDCSGGQIDKSRTICVWEEARCLPGLCTGCTAGGFGSCPPSPNRYGVQCSQDSVSTCRARAHSPIGTDPERTALIYSRNLRMLSGVESCDAFRAGSQGTSEEVLCAGDCPP